MGKRSSSPMAPSPVAASRISRSIRPSSSERNSSSRSLSPPKPSKPLGELVRGLAVKLGQSGEGRDDVAVKRDALAGGKLERTAHAALAQLECDRKRLGIDLVLVALKRRPHGVLQPVWTPTP